MFLQFFKKRKTLIISLLPILALTILVYREIKNEISLADLQKPEKIFTRDKIDNELNQENTATKNVQDNSTTYSSGLEIKGDENFKNQIRQALKLIWLYDRDTFFFIRKNVFEIRNENRTTFYFDEEKPVIAISSKQAYKSLTWAAGIIAHNAWHAYYELRKKKTKAKPVPLPGKENFFSDDKFVNPLEREYKTLEDMFKVEEYASQFQIKIMEEIGAPKSEIKIILNRKKEDLSVSHDGNYIVNP